MCVFLYFFGIITKRGDDMINVIEVISDVNIGGAGRLLINRLKNYDRDCFKYTVILPSKSLLSPSFQKLGVDVIEIDACKNESFDIKGMFELYKVIKRISPDILNSHACISARIAGKLASVRVNLYTRHCDFPVKPIYSIKPVRVLQCVIDDCLSDGIIAVSNSAKRNLLLRGAPREKIKVIINGAEPLVRLSDDMKKKIRIGMKIPIDATVVSIFARLESYKDHKTFLRAAYALKKFNNIYFLVVGKGSLDYKLKSYAKRLGIEDKVRFVGFVDDVTDLMNITDINVNCSIGTETSSLSLSEGMSIGIPAIASDYLGNRYMVRDGVNGFLFPQRDHIALARKILILTRNKTIYLKVSRNARRRFFEELNANRMTQETEKYYISLLKKS